PKGPRGCARGGPGAGAFRLAGAGRRCDRRGFESARRARGGGSARRRPSTRSTRGALVVAPECRRHLHVASLCPVESARATNAALTCPVGGGAAGRSAARGGGVGVER